MLPIPAPPCPPGYSLSLPGGSRGIPEAKLNSQYVSTVLGISQEEKLNPLESESVRGQSLQKLEAAAGALTSRCLRPVCALLGRSPAFLSYVPPALTQIRGPATL